MASNRKRRILIAALAVVGILFVWSLSGRISDKAFYIFLDEHRFLVDPVRLAFAAVGREREFDDRYFDIAIIRGVEGARLNFFEPDYPDTPSRTGTARATAE